MTNSELVNKAKISLQNSYSPYSGVKVGAALLTENGKVFTGCNIENSAFSPTICAERTAFAKAVSEGYKSFTKIAVVGEQNGKLINSIMPCGVRLQVMAEFCNSGFEIITVNGENKIFVNTLKQLLPNGFSLK